SGTFAATATYPLDVRSDAIGRTRRSFVDHTSIAVGRRPATRTSALEPHSVTWVFASPSTVAPVPGANSRAVESVNWAGCGCWRISAGVAVQAGPGHTATAGFGVQLRPASSPTDSPTVCRPAISGA